ncbi:GlxA family transcriptional regulator [Methylobacterium aquaticum]|uniref:GlxA family transcriptional regulator n=1 Tax=Methylobacterium aquaticum TaxID=270351 RepID=UPI003D16F0B0
MARDVVFVVFPGALLLDMSGPLGAFEISCEDARGEAGTYGLTVASRDGGLVRMSCGLEIVTQPLKACQGADTLIVVGGPGVHTAAADAVLLHRLRVIAAGARRVCSVCTGAFVIAAAGLLDGRRAVTHWGSCELLRSRFPDVSVADDAIYVKDGAVWTSAGVTSGIDLALALIEEDRGRLEAIRVARRLVVYLKRTGGQTQFSVPLSLQAADDGGFEALHAWVQSNLSADLRVEDLADRVGMSPRTFARHYAQRVGQTPAKVIERFRIEAARRALEETGLSVKEIAVQHGFGDEERMRRAFQRRLGVGPLAYRQHFSTT